MSVLKDMSVSVRWIRGFSFLCRQLATVGGLYARYALSEIDALDDQQVSPKVFWTTATPHLGLGVSQHTYLKLPRTAEFFISKALRTTGKDLFRYSNVLRDMVTRQPYLAPLQAFDHRIAHVNAFSTDFQVPTATAGFLADTDSIHYRADSHWEAPSFVKLVVETPMLDLRTPIPLNKSREFTVEEMATRLDAIGWVKIFCDVRDNLPSVPLPFSKTKHVDLEKESFMSLELKAMLAGWNPERFHIPLGHTVLVANSKNEAYANLNSAGKPYMGVDLLDLLN